MSSHDSADSANATRALREMMSRGRLDKYVPMKTEGGEIRTRHIVQEGPIAYLETTTLQEVFEEDATRMLSLATDESREQTAAIMKLQAEQAAWEVASEEEQEAIRMKHRTAQRMLEKLKVRIPFAKRLVLPANSLVARRAFPQLLTCIKAVALLRQKRKKVRDGGYVNATAGDYEIAYELMLPILSRTFAPLSQRALRLLAEIAKHAKTETFARAQCQQWAGVGHTEVRNRLNLLVEAGLVEQVTGGRGMRYTYRLINTSGATPPSLNGLIHPEDLFKALEAESKKKGQKAKKKLMPKTANQKKAIVYDEEE